MTWLLPIALVLVAALLLAAIHWVFVRWMASQTEAERVHEPAAPESAEADR